MMEEKRETFILCIKIGDENFTNSPFNLKIQEENYQSLKSLNFSHDNDGRTLIEFEGKMENMVRFQGKKVELFYFNHSIGKKFKQKMVINKILKSETKIIFECASLKKLLEFGKPAFFSMNCRANFGDKSCKVDIKKFSIEGIISGFNKEKDEILDEHLLISNPTIFEGGKIQIGNCFFIVLIAKNGSITILNETKIDFITGTKYLLIPSCNKTLKTCLNTYKNAINFQGEPFIFEKLSSSSF